MKIKICFFIAIVSVFMMSGCGLSHEIDEDTLLAGNSDYQQYIKYKDKYKYDENCEYIIEDNDDTNGKVHVTFAKNNLLDVCYYLDVNCNNPIETDNCYLTPGQQIYAAPELKNIEQHNYVVKSFDIYAYDGIEKNKKDIVTEKNDKGIYNVYTIPNEIRNDEISIVPVGQFTTNEISLIDEVNIDDEMVTLSENEWTIQIGNKQEKTKKDYFTIDPSSNYTIKYNYDPQKYYFISCEPECWRLDIKKGSIEFLTEEANNGSDSYKVTLGENQKFTIVFSGNASKYKVSIDDNAYTTIPETGSDYFAKENTLVKIKSSQQINDDDFTTTNLTKKAAESDGTVWVYEVGDGSGSISLDFNSLKYENGTVEFYDDKNKRITGNAEFNISTQKQYIRYKAIPDLNYNFCNLINHKTDLEGKIEVNGQLAYHLSNSLKFEKKNKIELNKPKIGGDIEYYKNDELCKERILEYLDSDIITAKIIPASDQGFKCKDVQTYKVEIKEGKVLFVNESTGSKYLIDDLFVESEEHKPILTVSLNKSVGNELEFSIYTNNNDIDRIGREINDYGKKYDNSLLNKKIVDSKKINTSSGIIFKVDNSSMPSSEALRFDVKKKDKDGKVTTSIYYVSTIPYTLTVKIDPNIFYSTVNVEINKVNIVKFGNYQAPNCIVKFEYADEEPGQVLLNKDITENSRKIRMVVTPADGYVLTGKNIKNGEYVKEGKVKNVKDIHKAMLKEIEAKE